MWSPPGSSLGPVLFLVMINDAASDTQLRWKYVDDLTIAEVKKHSQPSNIQSVINNLSTWSTDNSMTPKPEKCKIMNVSFLKRPTVFPNFHLGATTLECVDTLKLLGVIVQADMKWDMQTSHMTSVAAKRLYMLCILKKYKAPVGDLLSVYLMYIRPLLEYASPVWSPALTVQQSNKIERIQKRACRIIIGYHNYTDYANALEFLNIISLEHRRKQLFEKFAKSIISSRHSSMLPPLRSTLPNYRPLRSKDGFLEPMCRTQRYKKSPLPQVIKTLNNLM